jgi:hypothetical protein
VQTNEWSAERLSELVKQCLAEGKPVEIDGLGIFLPDSSRGFRFRATARPKIFIAYVMEDKRAAGRLYEALTESGFSPWLDKRKLLPGQNWPRAIESAIETSDFFLPCFSKHSVMKKGGFQAEIRYAMDCARLVPLDEIFIVPVRLDACEVPQSIQRQLQYIDLFPDWDRGLQRVLRIVESQMATRNRLNEKGVTDERRGAC